MIYNSDRIRVIRTRPRRRPRRPRIRINNTHNRPISPPNHQKHTAKNDKHTPTHHQHPHRPTLVLPALPVIVQPHAAHWLERHGGSEESSDKGDEAIEGGDRAGDDVGDDCDCEGAAEPGYPVDYCVG